MTDANFNPFNDEFTRKIVTRKAKQICRRAGFTPTDMEDIQQDLFLHVLQRWPKYDSAQGHRNCFITAIVERYVATILRDRCADKRDDRQTCSLSLLVEKCSEGSVEITTTISDRELDARIGRKRRDHAELARLRVDVAQVVAGLPSHWQSALELLKTYTITEVSKRMDVPRTTISSWIVQIRKRFAEAGIREYL